MTRPVLRKLSYHLQAMEYGVLLPVAARLPLAWGVALMRLRGRLNAVCGRDWTELSLGHAYLRPRALAAYREMFPSASGPDCARWTVERYQTIAREEFEGQLAIDGALACYRWNLQGLDPLAQKRQHGRGLVVVMPHVENLFFAVLGVAKTFGCTHLMTSDVVEDPRVHPSLRLFFARKYAAYQGMLGGGRFVHVGPGARDHFQSALERGETVVVISDAPARLDGPGTWVPWFGRQRKMTDSAWRMAKATGSQIAAVATRRHGLRGLTWHCSEVFDTLEAHMQADLPYVRIASFLEEEIRRNPGGWWAAHLLSDFPVWRESASASLESTEACRHEVDPQRC